MNKSKSLTIGERKIQQLNGEIVGHVVRTPAGALAAVEHLGRVTWLPEPEPPATLEWSGTLIDGARVSYAAAVEEVRKLGPEWRLPTRSEFKHLIECARLDFSKFTEQYPGISAGLHWSRSIALAAPQSHIDFDGTWRWAADFFGEYFRRIEGETAVCKVVAVRPLPVSTTPND